MLPGCFPKWELVYYYFAKLKNTGVNEQRHELLRDKIRKKAVREISQSLALIDSQSVKTDINRRVMYPSNLHVEVIAVSFINCIKAYRGIIIFLWFRGNNKIFHR